MSLKHEHEVPLRADPRRRRGERIRLLAQFPREEGGEPGRTASTVSQPTTSRSRKLGKKGIVFGGAAALFGLLGALTLPLHQQQVKAQDNGYGHGRIAMWIA